MDRSTPIYLVSTTYTKDDYGVMIPEETQRLVYTDVKSVTMTEWFEGGRNGLNPEYRFDMFAPDYQGEEILIYNDVYYRVYRTYLQRTDIIELYAEKRKGTDYARDESSQA